jgi:flagellin-like hook-associated protein FlgL
VTVSTAVALLTMRADPISEPVCHADDDVQARLAAIDHRLHQISTHLATIGQLLCQLDEIRTNLETLIESLGLAGLTVGRTACELPGCGERAP